MAALEFSMNEVTNGLPLTEEVCLTFSPDRQFPYEEIMYHIRNASFVISSKNIPGKMRENPVLLKVYLKPLPTRSS